MKNILKYILTFFILIIVFIVTLILSSLFPREWIQDETEESAKSLLQDETPQNRILDMKMDNYTDTLMINTAYSIDPKKPLESILLDRKNYLPEIEQIENSDVTGDLKTSKETSNNIALELCKTAIAKDTLETFEYARYWHGYLIWLRPALIFFNINQIKVIIEIILALLGIYLIVLLNKKLSLNILFVIILGMVVSDYFLMGLTFQGIMTFIISVVASIIICKRFNKIKNISIYFFVVGMLTSFFDLLTTPIITLGFPMIIYLLLKQKEEKLELKDSLKIVIKNTVLWGIAYALTYFSKWVIVDLLYDRGLILKALMQFMYRSNSLGSHCEWYEGIAYNFICSGIRGVIFTLIMIVYILIKTVKHYKTIRIDFKNSVIYLIIALMPIVWYLVLNNHSAYHYFFTYRGLMVFYIGIGIFLLKLLNLEGIEMQENNEIEKTGKKGIE